MSELIAANRQAYRDLAVDLGNNPERLAALKAKLAQNRATAPLFDTAGFARRIEEAYQIMHGRYRDGAAPDHIVIR